MQIEDGKAEGVEVTAYAREDNEKKGMDASQLTGATSSYARKYALAGLFLLDDNKDSDSTNEHGKGAQKASGEEKQKPPKEPRPGADDEQGYAIVLVKEVNSQKGTNKTTGKPWTRYVVKDERDEEYKTFSETQAQFCTESIGTDIPVKIIYTEGKFGKDIVDVSIAQGEM